MTISRSPRESLIPEEVRKQGISAEFSFVLKRWGEIVTKEKDAADAANAAKVELELIQKLADEIREEFTKAKNGIKEAITPSEVVVTTPETVTDPPISTDDIKDGDAETEPKKENPETDNQIPPTPAGIYKTRVRPESEYWRDSVFIALNELDTLLITEEFYEYYQMTDKAMQGVMRSAMKESRIRKTIIGLPFYTRAIGKGKKARKHYIHGLPRFFENGGTSPNDLLPNYKSALEQKRLSLNYLTAEEIIAEGGEIPVSEEKES
ncbi:hypothetical protein [Larkinella punicea]|uniref:Uncharacterized protein n=1 Tax=Larkinella punicea TaxID=2315727 RepID=A0A368JXQ9_9BACT|nr:hypothetical protein [Larkinella punicea]RCR71464.1 hypothetical protein DUE52_00570 [Larkinella punicea]